MDYIGGRLMEEVLADRIYKANSKKDTFLEMISRVSQHLVYTCQFYCHLATIDLSVDTSQSPEVVPKNYEFHTGKAK